MFCHRGHRTVTVIVDTFIILCYFTDFMVTLSHYNLLLLLRDSIGTDASPHSLQRGGKDIFASE